VLKAAFTLYVRIGADARVYPHGHARYLRLSVVAELVQSNDAVHTSHARADPCVVWTDPYAEIFDELVTLLSLVVKFLGYYSQCYNLESLHSRSHRPHSINNSAVQNTSPRNVHL